MFFYDVALYRKLPPPGLRQSIFSDASKRLSLGRYDWLVHPSHSVENITSHVFIRLPGLAMFWCGVFSIFQVKCEARSALTKPKNNHNNCKKVSNEEKPKLAIGEECRADEQAFLVALYKYMKERKTPIERIPYLGFKQSKYTCFHFWNTRIVQILWIGKKIWLGIMLKC